MDTLRPEWLDWNPVWSPDGSSIYFSSNRTGVMTLWRVPVAEQSGKMLGAPEAVTTPSAYSGQLSIAAAGVRLAYVQWSRTTNLEKIAFDPVRETVIGTPVPITTGSRQLLQPHLSPDGAWLTFASRTPQEDIWVMRTDGTGIRELTNDRYYDRLPRWSPDGLRIAFYSNRSGQWEIWSVSAEGTGLEQLTFTQTGKVLTPIWSPDGKRISCNNMGASPFLLDTGKPWRAQSPEYLPPSPQPHAFFLASSWSPDGSKLGGFLGRADGSGNLGVVVYSIRTREYEQVTASGSNVQWLSDSRRLLMSDQETLYLVDTRSKKRSLVLSLAPDGIYPPAAITKDDRTIFFARDRREADIWMMTTP